MLQALRTQPWGPALPRLDLPNDSLRTMRSPAAAAFAGAVLAPGAVLKAVAACDTMRDGDGWGATWGEG